MIEDLVLAPRHSISLKNQLAAQIGAAIRSGELDRGRRLPSSRLLANLLGLHRHTVLAAYAGLEGQGLVKRIGRSGVFVRPCAESGDARSGEGCAVSLEAAFAEFLRVQRDKGFSASDLNRLMSRWTDRSLEPGVVVVEPEPALRRLIAAEIADEVPRAEVTASSCCSARRNPDALGGRCVVARHEVAARLRGLDPAAADLVILRTVSVRECRRALQVLRTGQVAILLTSSRHLRGYVRELFAGELGRRVGLVCPKPWNGPELDRALGIADLVLTDLITTVPERPSNPGFAVRAVRIVDCGWIRELARYMGVAPPPRKKWPQAELERLRGIG